MPHSPIFTSSRSNKIARDPGQFELTVNVLGSLLAWSAVMGTPTTLSFQAGSITRTTLVPGSMRVSLMSG